MVTLDDVKQHFDRRDLVDRYDIFATHRTQVEGWFKGELILLFSRAKVEFQVDKPLKGQGVRPDFLLTDSDQKVILEIKCGYQKHGQDRSLLNWFNKRGVHKDFLKFDGVQGFKKWILVFMYPKPAEEYWNQVINLHKAWHCETSFAEYPNHLLIGSWRRT